MEVGIYLKHRESKTEPMTMAMKSTSSDDKRSKDRLNFGKMMGLLMALSKLSHKMSESKKDGWNLKRLFVY